MLKLYTYLISSMKDEPSPMSIQTTIKI